MIFVYTRANLKTRINAGIKGKIGILISSEDTMNEAVREVVKDADLRSAKRKASLSPKLFSDIYDYAQPSDLKALSIIDVPPQVKRAGEWYLVPFEEFDRLKRTNMIALHEYDGTKVLKIAADIDDDQVIVAELDSLSSGGGTWEAVGDAENLTVDSDNYVKGGGSINWDIGSGGGTTAGIKNTSLNSFDLDDDYLGGNGALFVWVYLNSATDVTNFILRIGSGESAYHQKTITTRHDGTAFVAGWNLLRFDLTSLSDTGSPDDDAITFISIYMTKDAGKVSETDYRFDWIVLKKGEIHEVLYYSKYGWQSSAGAYKENSTDDSDLLVADTDEFNLFVLKGREIAAEEVDETELAERYRQKYNEKLVEYKIMNPSEAKILTNEYYEY